MKLLKPGVRLKSAVCATEIMVIRAPGKEGLLCCGGTEMLAMTEAAPAEARLDRVLAQGSLIGKRYVDAEDSVELLCTKGGEGSLTLNGTALEIKQAKALPSSD
jgi:hypothetical protein